MCYCSEQKLQAQKNDKENVMSLKYNPLDGWLSFFFFFYEIITLINILITFKQVVMSHLWLLRLWVFIHFSAKPKIFSTWIISHFSLLHVGVVKVIIYKMVNVFRRKLNTI